MLKGFVPGSLKALRELAANGTAVEIPPQYSKVGHKFDSKDP